MASLFWVGVFVWQSSQPPNHTTAASQHCEGTKSECAKATTDERIADYTWWLAVLTAGLVLSGVIQFGFLLRSDRTARIAADAAKKSADVAESILIATQRPWIEITEMRVASPLVFDEQGGRVTIEASLRVVGQTPALNVGISGVFALLRNGVDPAVEQHRHCDEVLRRPVFASEPPIFPGGAITRSISLPIPQSEIDAAAAALPVEAAEVMKTFGIVGKAITPVLVGCIHYRFAFADGWHLSRFACHLTAATGLIDTSHPIIDISRLRLTTWIAGGFNVD